MPSDTNTTDEGSPGKPSYSSDSRKQPWKELFNHSSETKPSDDIVTVGEEEEGKGGGGSSNQDAQPHYVDMSQDTKAHFGYFEWSEKFDTEKPYYLYMDHPKGFPTTNFTTVPGPAELVHDLNQTTETFNLDDHGFMVSRQNLCVKEFNQDTVETHYLPSLEKLIRDAVGQDAEIVWFDWRTRSSDQEVTKLPKGTKIHLDDRSINLSPVKAVHVDQSASAAIKRVHHHSPNRADDILKSRVRIINVWRPYEGPVESSPIAVLDGSTVPSNKLVKVDIVRRTYLGESYYVLPHDQYKWYFINKQNIEDILLFKMYDSDENVKAKCCPHASFAQDLGPNARPRKSIEARALVYTPT
ncbi:7 alpha-cephem-methoxylase [Fusarium albosuccineum]|uniref:7 alpha-cephem-methoxylase n=1 Tax=Fusarium albosuccineum TaxID=1237068 RepID=A0A8H4L3R0_9HYPO|nr:7 alpha-cephem-methoxylase [Fusarium albosuccineum]